MAMLTNSVFFLNLLELQNLLEDKYKLLSMLFSFRSSLYKYHPSYLTTLAWLPPETLTILCRTQNRPFSPLKDSTVSILY